MPFPPHRQWRKYKFGGPGTVKMPGAPCFVLGPLTDFRGPTLIAFTYYRKWIHVRCRVMFSALGPGTDLNQAFRWKFWHFGAPERFLKVFGAPERRSGAFWLTFTTAHRPRTHAMSHGIPQPEGPDRYRFTCSGMCKWCMTDNVTFRF